MERKQKKCKGTGPAKGHGCGGDHYIHRYGLCIGCFKEWLFGTDEGKKVLEATKIRARKTAQKEAKKELNAKKEAARTKSWYEKKLQDEVNEIVRLIDTDKGCISCTHGWNKPATRQFHAGHRKSVGSNSTLRYHLFNIFKQCSICNNHLSGNERAFDEGILKHYGPWMLEQTQTLAAQFQVLHLSTGDLKEAITEARRIKKEILNGADITRTEINRRLGIYKHSSKLEALSSNQKL